MRIVGSDIGGDASEKADQAGRSGVAEISVGVEDILEGFEQGVVIERCVGNGARFEEGREQHGSGPIATVALKGQADRRSNVGGLREGSQVGTGLFIAAEQSWGQDREARRSWLEGESSFVKSDDDETVALVCGRGGDERNPLPEEGVRRDEAARLTVLAGCVVAIVAEVWSDEGEIRRGGFVEEVSR